MFSCILPMNGKKAPPFLYELAKPYYRSMYSSENTALLAERYRGTALHFQHWPRFFQNMTFPPAQFRRFHMRSAAAHSQRGALYGKNGLRKTNSSSGSRYAHLRNTCSDSWIRILPNR